MHFSTALPAIACLLGTQLLATASPHPQPAPLPNQSGQPLDAAITDDTIQHSIRLYVKSGCVAVSKPLYYSDLTVSLCNDISIVESADNKGLGLALFQSEQKTTIWGCFPRENTAAKAQPGCKIEVKFPKVGAAGADYHLSHRCLYDRINKLVSKPKILGCYEKVSSKDAPTLDNPWGNHGSTTATP